VPGTHKEAELRPHNPLLGDREKSHTLVAQLNADDVAVPAVISRGDLTVHSERIVHGSGEGNLGFGVWSQTLNSGLSGCWFQHVCAHTLIRQGDLPVHSECSVHGSGACCGRLLAGAIRGVKQTRL
jgi:hypothetical protein